MKKSIICLLILLSLLALIACAKNADGDSASMQSGSRSDSFVAGSSSNSENQNADINEEFEDYEKSAYTLDNAYAENASVDLITYAKGETSKDSRLILYVINTEAARVGTESDVSIISDFLDEGYVVTVADYKNDARAVSPELEWSTLSIKLAMASGSYYENVNFNPDKIYMVPSGCRIKTDITYFDYLESASVGTKEYCVKVWNGDLFRTKYGNKVPGGYFEATDFSQLINSDGSPVDTTLKMDIIYPSQPINKTPLFMLASSTGDPSKRNLSTMTADRPHYDGFLFRGYACACYDHEFIPFLKGYGYQDTYTLNNWNGVKTQTAAVRCARYYADSFGYDVDRIGVMGHSKSSYCLLLANPDPTSIKEKNSFSGFDPNETYGEQPYLTYKGTDEPIPSHANVVYASMGMGAKSYEYYNIGSDSAPVMIASGYYCQYNSWAYWSDLQQYYMEKDVTHLPISMWDLGHVYAYGTDTV